MAQYAYVIVPVAVKGPFTYALDPQGTAVGRGMRVVVPFGTGRKLYTGIVVRTHDQAPGSTRTRKVHSVLDQEAIVPERVIRFWMDMANHYLCSAGEVMLAAMPAQLVLNSSTRICTTASTPTYPAGNAGEAIFLSALEDQGRLSIEQAGELLGVKDPLRKIKDLIEAGAVGLEEHVRDTFRPRTKRMVRLAESARDEASLRTWFDTLEKAPKQLAILMRFIELGRGQRTGEQLINTPHLLKSAGADRSALRTLIAKGLFEEVQVQDGLEPTDPIGPAELPTLSQAQSRALAEVRERFGTHPVVLLQGVTGSGKTELYMHLIQEALDQGGQVLYLLPEIALTKLSVQRLRNRFGEHVHLFHSRLTPHQRAELWSKLASDKGGRAIVLGVRSALLLPFQDLHLIIVDEEHDPSFKQHKPAPRYNARDMAVTMASPDRVRVLLGSATPSLESAFNARTGKYGFVKLTERYGGSTLPEVVTVDLREAQKKKRLKGHFSPQLLQAVDRAVQRREQVILFQNRRGYSPIWQCTSCGHIPGCAHCDVSLTYHKRDHDLRCHYCGCNYEPPTACPECRSGTLRMLGSGTERIEEELTGLLPEVRVARLDQDTARGKHAVEQLMSRFDDGELDVLVGTQMVTKGLDLDRVSLVGIMNADRLWGFPDLRAHERAFQLMAQVAGRSGRRRDPGQVIIQAYDIAHPVLQFVLQHDVDGFTDRELEHRRVLGYPPFSRMVRFTLKHRKEGLVAAAAAHMARELRHHFGDRALGPEVPAVAWVRDQHIRNILVKLRRSDHAREKALLAGVFEHMVRSEEHGRVRIIADVDPM
ncbi:MAG: primosomal protein N' [Flavobacteriales bacterium]|nr:primosomal protein N' [Flavobacteriales bacterium]